MRQELRVILSQLRQEFTRIFGESLEAMYLYGSQARGDASPDSDIDVLVVIRGDFNYFDFLHQTDEITASLALAHDVVISRVFVSKEKLERSQRPFIINVRKEAMAI